MKKLDFDTWMKVVSRIMYNLCGMGPDDLPDWRYRSAYDEGKSPDRAARSAIAAAKKGY